MGRVIGIGGVFFRCRNPDATRAWYRDILGLEINAYGGSDFRHDESAAAFGEGARTVWAPFGAETDYFGPGGSDFMVNYIVDDLEAVRARASAAGVAEDKPAESHDYGAFAWLPDPDGRRVELWQPNKG